MKRDGFLLTEIIISVCIVALIAVILFPLKIIDLNQAERIAAWKTFYPDLLYSFDLMRIDGQKFISDYKNTENKNPVLYFDYFTKYLDIDYGKPVINNYFNYHHMFLNGKTVRNLSKYKANKFVSLKNGMIIGFAGINDIQNEDNVPLGILFVDVDGKTKQNSIGKDVFVVLLYTDKIVPMGASSTIQEMKEDCSAVGSGLKCAAYYLMGSSF